MSLKFGNSSCPGEVFDRLRARLCSEIWHGVQSGIRFSSRLSSGVKLAWCNESVITVHSERDSPFGFSLLSQTLLPTVLTLPPSRLFDSLVYRRRHRYFVPIVCVAFSIDGHCR
ncbi:hypothetical protein [Nostoc sp.]